MVSSQRNPSIKGIFSLSTVESCWKDRRSTEEKKNWKKIKALAFLVSTCFISSTMEKICGKLLYFLLCLSFVPRPLGCSCSGFIWPSFMNDRVRFAMSYSNIVQKGAVTMKLAESNVDTLRLCPFIGGMKLLEQRGYMLGIFGLQWHDKPFPVSVHRWSGWVGGWLLGGRPISRTPHEWVFPVWICSTLVLPSSIWMLYKRILQVFYYLAWSYVKV